jgi:hypothetical protein
LVVTFDQIKFYLSGGVSNTNPLNSKGGAISNTIVERDAFNSIFDDITATENNAGSTEHRCIYAKNTNGTDQLRDPRIYFDFVDPFVGVGITTHLAGETESDLPDETTPIGQGSPNIAAGVTGSEPTEWRPLAANTVSGGVKSLDNLLERVGVAITSAKPETYNHRLDVFECYLSKTGTPTGTITFSIRNQSDNYALKRASFYTTVDAATLTGSLVKKTIKMPAVENYTPELGDIVCIEYAGGTASNKVNVGYNSTPVEGQSLVTLSKGTEDWTFDSTKTIQGVMATDECGPGGGGGGGDPNPPPDPIDPPVSFSGFTQPTKYENGLLLNTIPPGSYRAFWLQRKLKPNQKKSQDMVFSIRIKGGWN